MSRLLDRIAQLYADKLDELFQLLDSGAPADRLAHQSRVLAELAHTYSALREGGIGDGPTQIHNRSSVNDRVYVFVRNGAMYECTRGPDEHSVGPAGARALWTVRMSGCEVNGPACTGREFSDTEHTIEFEDLAVAAVRACTKPCAIR